MFFFTSDEHYNHKNIIKYCKRPFSSVEEMNDCLITNHNQVVGKDDVTYHLGDFTLGTRRYAEGIISKLNGSHIFLRGSHDVWLPRSHQMLVERKFGDIKITLCHYCLRTWPKSHFNTWHLFGHSHGDLPPIGKSLDVGVDTNNFFPYSLDEIKYLMKLRPNNFNHHHGESENDKRRDQTSYYTAREEKRGAFSVRSKK